MVQVFKSRTTIFQITVFVLVIVVCILVPLLDAAHSWSCLALLTPVISTVEIRFEKMEEPANPAASHKRILYC